MKYQVDKYHGDIKKLRKRISEAEALHELWRALYEEAFDYVMPERNTFTKNTPGEKKTRHVYDSTAVEGLEVYVNKIQAGFFPDWNQWMELQAGMEIPAEERKEKNEQLEAITELFFGYFHQTNFSTTMNPTLKDWSVSTACLDIQPGRMEAGDGLWKFSNVPLPQLLLESTSSDDVKNSWRKYEIELEQILATWPDAELGDKLTKRYEKDPFAKITIVDGHLYNYKTNRYHQYVLEKDGKHIIFSQSFKTKRRIVFRPSVVPGEVYGRGTILRLLSDILTTNKVVEFLLKNGAIQVAGLFTGVNDGIFNPYTVKIHPGTIIPVQSNSTQNPTLSRIPMTGDMGMSQLILKDIQDRIRTALMAMPMGEVNDPVKSATEQMLRHQDDVKRSSTSFGRLYNEFIIPLVKACLEIGAEKGKLPDLAVNGRQVKVKIVSPLAKQKEMEDFTNSQTYFSMVMQLPEMVAMGSSKLEDFPEYWADKLSMPMKLVRGKKEREELAKNMIALAQQIPEGGGGEPV